MPRTRVGDPELRPLIDRLAALWLQEGSVNRVQRVLSEQLEADGLDERVYANRLHALLSEDPGKSVNPATLQTVEAALDRIPIDAAAEAKEATSLKREVTGRWPGAEVAVPGGGLTERIRHLAAELGVPPAIVRLLLDGVPAATSNAPGVASAATSRREPDWSFQDVACEQCVRALAKDPNRKVGLILPTGGGKTRVAIRILLQILDRTEIEDPRVIWVTHRTRLKVQASRELQRAIGRGTPDLPAQATALLADQVEFCMLSKLSETLSRYCDRVALVVVDEAHHAAASSYAPLFEQTPLNGLFLTATPNRTDLLPIGIDEISFAITYRELFDRGVIVEPDLDELTIPNFDMGVRERLDELAVYLLEEAQDRFAKTLVAVSRVESAEALHEALARGRPAGHVLAESDIGFVHGGGSSHGQEAQDFLDEFQARPRGILVATRQLLGEGFDDPAVDTAVVTYPTESILDLMQVAGRCMRYAPGKDSAQVIQVRDSSLAYHWEQGWLYQDISDLLRPRLEKVTFEGEAELRSSLEEVLSSHNVSPAVKRAVLEAAEASPPGMRCSLLLTGLPYSGPTERFDRDAHWGAVFVSPAERDLFLRVFNDYSARIEEVNDKKTFLEHYMPVNRSPGSRWRRYMDMLAAMDAAAAELSGEAHASASRPTAMTFGTTWLIYTTFEYEPSLPPELEAFLSDAVNRDEVVREFSGSPKSWSLLVKAPLPLNGTLAALIPGGGRSWVERERDELRGRLGASDQRDSFAAMESWRAGLGPDSPLPRFLEDRFELLLGSAGWARYALPLEATSIGSDP